MKILEFNDRGLQVERDSNGVRQFGSGSHLAPAPALGTRTQSVSSNPSDIQLYMFQTGTLQTKTKFIKMNQAALVCACQLCSRRLVNRFSAI